MIKNHTKIQLKGLNLEELKNFFKSIGEPPFRGEQVFKWMYDNQSTGFSEMLNLSKPLREKLSNECSLQSLEPVAVQNSLLGGTHKYLFKTRDNKKIESVVIPSDGRSTLCVSTQVGCPLDCKFCATGIMGYKRNLTIGEIIDQYLLTAKDYGKDNITNLVYMGMGEPLLNFKATLKSLKIFTHEFSKSFSRTKITLSTAGIPHKIKELAESDINIKLALSLHSCFEDIRSKIMPINLKYSLKKNIEAIKYYSRKTKTRITFEYTMLKGLNDRDKDIEAVTILCRQLPAKINIIPFNSITHMNPDGISAELEPTPYPKILEFADKLRENHITVMVRDTKGDDIAAACGQLAVKY